jgi:DNA invertase Pin-like site-specific DNA recombinase
LDGKTDSSAVANVGYARVSTLDQDLSLQLDALAVAGCSKVFADYASGARADLQAALDYVRNGEVLVVWNLDRLGRSLPHLIETITALSKRGVGFRSLTKAIDTTTSGGRLIFHIFGALGQFERDLIPGAHARRPCRRCGAGAQERPQARHYGGKAEARARHDRKRPDRARDRDPVEGQQDRALRGT